MARVLHLTLKKKWFDMIESGEKLEEYREIKPHWIRRLMLLSITDAKYIEETAVELKSGKDIDSVFYSFKYVVFRNGYGKNAPELTVECLGIDIGPAKPEWSDNWQGDVFRIKLGKTLTTNPTKTNNHDRPHKA